MLYLSYSWRLFAGTAGNARTASRSGRFFVVHLRPIQR